ncbi:MAG: CHASE2 domain-containing protein [Polaromonas sp.]
MRFDGLKPRWAWLAPALTVSLGLVVYLFDPLPVQTARHAVFDQFQRWQPRAYKPAPVRIIDIDDESLGRLGQWPWPRTRMAGLIEQLQAAGASAIVLDMVFAEPDRTSPAAMLDLWQPSPEIASQISRLPDHDAVLASVLGRGRVVLGFVLDRQPQSQSAPAPKARFVAINEPAQPYVHAFSGGAFALPALVDAAQGHGAFSFVPDADGVVRRLPLLVRQGDTLLPSLDAEALRVAQGVQNIGTRTVRGVGLQELRIGALTVPTTPQGDIWVRYTEPAPQRSLPAWKVLAGDVPASELAGRIVLVGASAQGLADLRLGALGTVLPGVEIHAQLLEQILTGDGLSRPGWAPSLEVLGLLAGGLLVGAVALGLGALPSAAVFCALLALMGAALWRAFSNHGLLLDPVLPGLTMALSFVLSSTVRHVRTERRQRWVKQAFSRYVSPNIVTYLVAHPQALVLGGRRQHCSFVFTDLENFTSLMEHMDPAHAVGMMNRYLDEMIAIVFAHQGTLTRIVGDGLAILFSAPVAQSDHASRALQCALAMQRFARQYARELNNRGLAFGQTRMGVHTGEVIVGNFGGAAIFDYRALGDPVNTAARLESANRHLGTLMCVSQAVLDACPSVQARPIGRLMLKGKSQSIMVFEPLDGATQADADYLRAFELLRGDGKDALVAFEQLAALRPADSLVAMHLARLRAGRTGELIMLDAK